MKFHISKWTCVIFVSKSRAILTPLQPCGVAFGGVSWLLPTQSSSLPPTLEVGWRGAQEMLPFSHPSLIASCCLWPFCTLSYPGDFSCSRSGPFHGTEACWIRPNGILCRMVPKNDLGRRWNFWVPYPGSVVIVSQSSEHCDIYCLRFFSLKLTLRVFLAKNYTFFLYGPALFGCWDR